MDYEQFLKKARAEGWRDPIQITDLEIKAYRAGMTTERKRVLSILKEVEDNPVMRIMDFSKYIDKIKKTNNNV